jgi:hypothetical protein
MYGVPQQHVYSFSIFITFFFFHSKQLKGPGTATLYKPPLHYLFNALNNNQVGQVSALLEQRVCPNTQLPSLPAAPTMNFNLNIPAEVAMLLCPHALLPAADTPVSTAHDPGLVLRPLLVVSNTMLVSSDRLSGPELSLADFCSRYSLTASISQNLDENGYAGSHTFEYASWNEIRDVCYDFDTKRVSTVK